MIRPIHPFPARMAPELAIASLVDLRHGDLVLDPMAGSGTVLRQASERGHRAIGFDMDPLAVLMSRVWTTPVDDAVVKDLAAHLLGIVRDGEQEVELPWIDQDEETRRFVDYWFAEPQQSALRRIAYALSLAGGPHSPRSNGAAADVLRIALSRIIITKDQGASLARDVSHSRPHKVADQSRFDVMPAFERSVGYVRRLLELTPPPGRVDVRLGDARTLRALPNAHVDAVLTSPPYLNAIDYMRGHRFSLVWLGYRLSDLRHIRATSIGAERGPDGPRPERLFVDVREAMASDEGLPPRHQSMVARYAEDIYRLLSEIVRVLKPTGRATLIVGNSCLKGVFIRNSDGVIKAATMVGLRLLSQVERELPRQSRYLPMPARSDGPLGKRIRTETILTFVHN